MFQYLGWQVSFGNSWLAGLGHQAAPGENPVKGVGQSLP
jgi:hypothetical protein